MTRVVSGLVAPCPAIASVPRAGSLGAKWMLSGISTSSHRETLKQAIELHPERVGDGLLARRPPLYQPASRCAQARGNSAEVAGSRGQSAPRPRHSVRWLSPFSNRHTDTRISRSESGSPRADSGAPASHPDLASWASDVQPSRTAHDSERSPSPTTPRSPIMHLGRRGKKAG